MATEVSVLDKYGETTYYSNYADARRDIINSEIEHPLVQIWADLDEQIILLDEADIWIAPGVTISNSSGDTITDNNVAVKCNISGYGNLTQTSTGFYAVCNFTNSNSKVSVKCDIIENESASQACVSSSAKKFHLECNLVYGKSHGGVYLNNNNSDDLNINAEKIVTGEITELSLGTTAIISRGNGFMHINEILCRNLGHCLSHRAGEIIANIFKLITVTRRTGDSASTAQISQGSQSQKLILYFDEINALSEGENISSNDGIQVTQGIGIFIGRKVTSKENYAVQFNGFNLNGYIKCNEIESDLFYALGMNNFTTKVEFNINNIQGNNDGVVFAYGSANFILKSSKIKNLNSNLPSRVISLYKYNNTFPNSTFNNIKLITGNTNTTEIILSAEFPFPNDPFISDITNFGLFVNEGINSNYINLLVGIDNNFLYIDSIDLN